MKMLMCIKQHISKIWSSIYENVKWHWGWVDELLIYFSLTLVDISSLKFDFPLHT